MRSWLEASKVYWDWRIVVIFCLGISSGLPQGVILGDPLTAMLSENGVSKSMIGFFALLSIPYGLKFLWAPFIDKARLPLLATWLGRRRSWAIVAQIVLWIAMAGVGFFDPQTQLWWIGLCTFIVAFASASQDIVIDAYRIEILDDHMLAAGSASVIGGWRLGQFGGGAAGLVMADFLPWSTTFAILSCIIFIGVLAILFSKEPRELKTEVTAALEAATEKAVARFAFLGERLQRLLAWLFEAIVLPFVEFFQRVGLKDGLLILAFILLYKFGDQILSLMQTPFFLETGFTKTEIAGIKKVFGFNAILVGSFLGGIVIAYFGLLKGLLIAGVLMAGSNLVFALQAVIGAELWMLTVTVAVENITTGIGTVAFVAYLSHLCNVTYTATQYALLTSFMAMSRVVMSSVSGVIADHTDWVSFFMITTVLALPGLALLVWLMRKPHLR